MYLRRQKVAVVHGCLKGREAEFRQANSKAVQEGVADDQQCAGNGVARKQGKNELEPEVLLQFEPPDLIQHQEIARTATRGGEHSLAPLEGDAIEVIGAHRRATEVSVDAGQQPLLPALQVEQLQAQTRVYGVYNR